MRKLVGELLEVLARNLKSDPPGTTSGHSRPSREIVWRPGVTHSAASLDRWHTAYFTRGQDLIDQLGHFDRLTFPYAMNPTVHRAGRVIADTTSAVEFELFKGDTDEVADEKDPVVKVFDHPNARMSGKDLWCKTALDLILFGNALWFMDGMARLGANRGKFPTAFRPLRIHGAEPRFQSGELAAWSVQTRLGTKTYPMDSLVHFRLENPYDEDIGLSEIAAAFVDADSMFKTARSNQRMVERGGPRTQLVRGDPNTSALFDDVNEDELTRQLDEEYQEDNQHRAFAPPPGMRVERIGAGPREMDFEKLALMNRENIAGATGAPPALLGILDKTSYSNMQAMLEYMFYFTADPLWSRLESAVQVQVLDRFQTGLRGFFKRETARAMFRNLGASAETAIKLREAGFSKRQINDRLDLGFDVDDHPDADTVYAPFQLQPVTDSDFLEEPVTPAAPSVSPGEVQKLKARSSHWPKAEKARARIWHGVIRRPEGLERRFLGDYRGFLKWLGDTSIENLRETQSRVTHAPPPAEFIPHEARVEAELFRRIDGDYRAGIRMGAETISEQLGVDITFGETDPRVIEMLAERRMAMKTSVFGVLGHQAGLLGRLRDAIGDGIQAGEPVDLIADRIVQFTRQESFSNARRIARTEVSSIFSRAEYESIGLAGLDMVEWLTARDLNVRDSHAAQDGEIRRLGDRFPNGLKHPLEYGGPAAEVIMCRCVLLPVINARAVQSYLSRLVEAA